MFGVARREVQAQVQEATWIARLRLPVIAAPMFLVSGPDLVVAACRSGIVGAVPAANARTPAQLAEWLCSIRAALTGDERGTWALNLSVHRRNPRLGADLELVREFQPPLVTTALGSPAAAIEIVKRYGGFVFADVVSVEQARKAASYGVDGLILVTAGAGGHTGSLSPFTFVPAVRDFWSGYIALAGGIADGRGIWAALQLGADLACLGTRFIATQESLARGEYKQMLVESCSADVLCTDAFTGIPNNMLKPSIRRAGIDPDNIPPKERSTIDFDDPHRSAVAWRDIWSAGHSVELVDDIDTTEGVVTKLEQQYLAHRAAMARRYMEN